MPSRIPYAKPLSVRAPQAKPPVTRESPSKRGYDNNWRKIRAMQLREFPLCANPHGLHDGPVAATEVDHKRRLSRGGTHDPANLQSLCKPCHSRKTATEA